MNFSKTHTSNEDIKKIEIPKFLIEEDPRKIKLPSFLEESTTPSFINCESLEITPYWCGNCETSLQQCRECTSCQGCENSCLRCEDCMDYCETNGECNNCLRVCQDCQTACQGKCQTTCEICESTCERICQSSCEDTCQSGQHVHDWKYTDWQYADANRCKRLKYCAGAGTCPIGASEQYQAHSYWIVRYEWVDRTSCRGIFRCFYCKNEYPDSASPHIWTVVSWEQGNETHCDKHVKCSACGGTDIHKVKHEFVNGICKWCGRDEFPFPPNFEWSVPKVKGQTFYFGVDEYKTLVEYLNQKLTYFKKTKVSKTTVVKGEKVLATTMNEILAGLRRINATGVPGNVSPRDTITANFLNAIRDSLNSVKKPT